MDATRLCEHLIRVQGVWPRTVAKRVQDLGFTATIVTLYVMPRVLSGLVTLAGLCKLEMDTILHNPAFRMSQTHKPKGSKKPNVGFIQTSGFRAQCR